MSLHDLSFISVVSNILSVYQFLADPGWTSQIVKEAIEFLFGKNKKPWVLSLNLIGSQKIVIVSIFFKFKLKLLLKFEFVIDRRG